MKKLLSTLCAAAEIGSCLLPSAYAQTARSLKSSSEPRIILYENPNYSGKTLPLYGSGEISDLHKKDRGSSGDWNDQLSAIEFDGNFTLTLYSDANFQGDRVTVKTSQRTLYSLNNVDWDNTVSSVKWATANPGDTKPQAIFYEAPNYQGRSFILNGGNQVKDLRDKKRGSRLRDWNDEISSVRLLGVGTEVTFYTDKNYRGRRLTITASKPNLASFQFSKRASSVIVDDSSDDDSNDDN